MSHYLHSITVSTIEAINGDRMPEELAEQFNRMHPDGAPWWAPDLLACSTHYGLDLELLALDLYGPEKFDLLIQPAIDSRERIMDGVRELSAALGLDSDRRLELVAGANKLAQQEIQPYLAVLIECEARRQKRAAEAHEVEADAWLSLYGAGGAA